MPEINKNYNTEEHKILCMNGQKEYCPKKRYNEEEGTDRPPVEGRFSALFAPSTEAISFDEECVSVLIQEGRGVILGYFEVEMSDFEITSITLYPDMYSMTPITKFPGYPDMISFRIYDYCNGYNLDAKSGKYISTRTF